MKSVADPGFPRGGGANPKGGVPTYYLANFSRKLHENEEILGQRGGAHPSCPPLDPPLEIKEILVRGGGRRSRRPPKSANVKWQLLAKFHTWHESSFPLCINFIIDLYCVPLSVQIHNHRK